MLRLPLTPACAASRFSTQLSRSAMGTPFKTVTCSQTSTTREKLTQPSREVTVKVELWHSARRRTTKAHHTLLSSQIASDLPSVLRHNADPTLNSLLRRAV